MSPPRVAVVYDSFFPSTTGGGERVYRRLSELLVDRGASVSFLTRRLWAASEPPPASFDIDGVWEGEIYDARGARTTASAVLFAAAVYRRLRRNRAEFDIVIASALPVLTLIAARLALRGTLVWLVGDWLEVWSWSKWRRYAGPLSGTIAFVLQSVGARCADLDTVNSSFTATRLARRGASSTPLVLGLVDLGGEPPASIAASRPPYILFVGRHIVDKRIGSLPAALAVARSAVPDLRLIVAGDGPDTPSLVAELTRTGMSEFTELVGRVDDRQLSELLVGASAVVNPSSREGFGLVVAEAAAAGVPSVVVAGVDNAAVELIDEGVNGVVASSVDPEILGSAIVRAVEDRTMRQGSADWYRRERVSRGLGASVDELLARYADRSASRTR